MKNTRHRHVHKGWTFLEPGTASEAFVIKTSEICLFMVIIYVRMTILLLSSRALKIMY